MLLSPGEESHSYEPTPQDIIAIQNCDLFLYIGGESDNWVSEILNAADGVRALPLMDYVDLKLETLTDGMEGEADGDYDEHIWTSPQNASVMVSAIEQALADIDPDGADVYLQNLENYNSQLETLDSDFREVISSAKRNTLVFADRFPFRYFADQYGLDCYAAFPGCYMGSEPSAATVVFLIDKVQSEHIPVVFYIEFSNEKMADTICEATGAKKLLFHSCHNVTKTDFEKGETYLSLMHSNVLALKEALN